MKESSNAVQKFSFPRDINLTILKGFRFFLVRTCQAPCSNIDALAGNVLFFLGKYFFVISLSSLLQLSYLSEVNLEAEINFWPKILFQEEKHKK